MRISLLNRFAEDRRGATALEYGLIVGVIAVGLITTLGNFGNTISNTFTRIGNSLSTVAPAATN